jgi:asparaginyl-tRNA synthetase
VLTNLRCNDVKARSYEGKEVILRGWVHRIRQQKELTFALLRDDRGGVIQFIISAKKVPALTIESCIQITGIVRQDSRAPEGGYEIRGTALKIFGMAKVDYPIGEYQSEDLLLNYRHLAVRTRRMITIAKIRATILRFSRQWFIEHDWLEVNAPVIVRDAVEGGSTLFKLRYFDQTAFLSQSAQLYLEAMVFALGPVWSISESFRAERSRTIRHLAEFTHLEAEAPWISLEDIMKTQENLICFILKNTLSNNSMDFGYLNRDVGELGSISPPFEKISYGKAIDILLSKDFTLHLEDGTRRRIEWGDDLNIESERELTKDYTKPIFIFEYPISLKPFYVKEDTTKSGLGLSADLLAPRGFGEITSGGERESSIESITRRIEEQSLDPKAYEWYLDLRRYGSVPHAGFGLGIERLVRWILGVEDIKDVVLFPRTMSRVTP